MNLWPFIPEQGPAYRLTAPCSLCDGTGTAEIPPASGCFDDCALCGGSGEVEVDPAKIRERADA